MKYKGYKELMPTSHWIKVDGTDYYRCSECGHMQDIISTGNKACEECGTWMVMKLVREEQNVHNKREKTNNMH